MRCAKFWSFEASLLRGQGCRPPRERFSRVLGMFSSLEVKVLCPT